MTKISFPMKEIKTILHRILSCKCKSINKWAIVQNKMWSFWLSFIFPICFVCNSVLLLNKYWHACLLWTKQNKTKKLTNKNQIILKIKWTKKKIEAKMYVWFVSLLFRYYPVFYSTKILKRASSNLPPFSEHHFTSFLLFAPFTNNSKL